VWLHEIKHGGFSHDGRAEIDLFVTAITAAEAIVRHTPWIPHVAVELTGEDSDAQDQLVRRCCHFVRDEFRNMGGLDIRPLPLKSKSTLSPAPSPQAGLFSLGRL
jgi:hypothetical protein